MSLEKLKQLIQGKFFSIEGATYTFVPENTLKINGIPFCHYRLYEENEQFYLETKPSLRNNEDFLISVVDENPLTISLTTKLTQIQHITIQKNEY